MVRELSIPALLGNSQVGRNVILGQTEKIWDVSGKILSHISGGATGCPSALLPYRVSRTSLAE